MTRFVYALDEPHGDTLDDAKALVGGKAANLGVMARDLVLPVPPGFAITTQTCREFLSNGWPDGLEDEIRSAMADVDAKVGRRFSDDRLVRAHLAIEAAVAALVERGEPLTSDLGGSAPQSVVAEAVRDEVRRALGGGATTRVASI